MFYDNFLLSLLTPQKENLSAVYTKVLHVLCLVVYSINEQAIVFKLYDKKKFSAKEKLKIVERRK